MAVNKVAEAICEVLLIGISALELATGKQFLVVYDNLLNIGLSVQFGVLQSDAVTFFIIGGFTILASLMGFLFMNSTEVTSRNSIFFLTLTSFCMQATAATLSSIDSTVLHEQLAPLSGITLPSYLSLLKNELIAVAVLAFVISAPCLIYLIHSRWSEWAECKRVAPSPAMDQFQGNSLRRNMY